MPVPLFKNISDLTKIFLNNYVLENYKRVKSIISDVLVMSLTWFVPYFPLIMVYTSELVLLIFSNLLNVKKALRLVAEMWIGYLRLCHNHSVIGLENIPSDGPGLIVWYHGPVPVDYMGLIAKIYKEKKRKVYSVVDKCLTFLPGLEMFKSNLNVGSFSKVRIAGLLESGHLVGVAPGGARECLFDHDCQVLWKKRIGFAKVANLTKIPIIPVYTENIRLAYTAFSLTPSLSRTIYELTRLPFVLLYGGFPVTLRTHVGSPMFARNGETPEQLQIRLRSSMKDIIASNQKSTTLETALRERFALN